ncbi:MAG: hypothetical protein AB8G05_24735 [Oligoflexales bacterium]
MLPLTASISMLALAPLLYKIASHFQVFWSYTHKILVSTVTSLVVLHLLPESIRTAGWLTLVGAFAGLWLPPLLERLWSSKAHTVHLTSLLIAILGLTIHGMMDGAALSSPQFAISSQTNSLILKWAVILHRLPAALLLWSLFYPKKGGLFPTFLLAVLGIATIIGYSFGSQFLESLNDVTYYYHFQALVSGSLLHIAFDTHEDH